MDKNYGGLIWTNHALSRLSERGIKQGDAWATWRNPDQTRKGVATDSWIYYKTYGDIKIEVVAKQNENKEWIVLSIWSRKIFNEAKKKKTFWQVLFGGYIDLAILIVASTTFLPLLILYSLFANRNTVKIEDNVESIKESNINLNYSPTASPVTTIFPLPTSTTTPTVVPSIKPTTNPTRAPSVNNIPPTTGYSRQSVSTSAGIFTVSIISADISSTRVIVDTASTQDCSSNCPALSLSDYVTRNNGFAGINGSYFCPKDYPSCAGKENTFDLLVMNKDKYYFNSANNVYSTNPAVVFGSGYVRFFTSAGGQIGRDSSPNGVLMNFPLLVFNGEIKFTSDGDPKKGSKGNRSFVATKGNTVYIGVVHSATVGESAVALKTLGMENGLNLDNGGSTALWYGGYKVGPGRAIPNAIIFTR